MRALDIRKRIGSEKSKEQPRRIERATNHIFKRIEKITADLKQIEKQKAPNTLIKFVSASQHFRERIQVISSASWKIESLGNKRDLHECRESIWAQEGG